VRTGAAQRTGSVLSITTQNRVNRKKGKKNCEVGTVPISRKYHSEMGRWSACLPEPTEKKIVKEPERRGGLGESR